MSDSSPHHTAGSSPREVADGIYRFGTHRINWYVLEAEGELTVVDAGLPGHWPQFRAWLDDTNQDLDDVAALVLTHADADHVGFAATLADLGVPVYLHPDDISLLRNQPASPPRWFIKNLWRPAFIAYAVEMIRDGLRSIESLDEANSLTDGKVLDVPGTPRVIVAPGHTPGSCALYIEDREVLFCGDILATRNIFTGTEGDPQLLGDADEDHDEARASLSHLEGLGTVTMLPGHGNPWHGNIDDAIAHAR